MNMLRKSLLLLLAALLIVGCVPCALAANSVTAVVSTQKLEIDGADAPTTAYNIGGNNYFKLRDIAYLLNDTPARFSVSYNRNRNAVEIATGASYTANGSELVSLGKDAQTGVPSPQTIYIDGSKVGNLSVYNIKGNNFFKLRDLGDALGFRVDYDEARKTMLIQTGSSAGDWDPDIRFTTVDMNGGAWTDACFAEHKLTVINLWAYWCGPCVGEMPDLQKLSVNYADKGVQLLGISMQAYEAQNIETLRSLGVTYPCLRYTEDFDAWMNTGYIPTTIFVDSSGKVLDSAYVGSRDYASWAAIIDGYLK